MVASKLNFDRQQVTTTKFGIHRLVAVASTTRLSLPFGSGFKNFDTYIKQIDQDKLMAFTVLLRWHQQPALTVHFGLVASNIKLFSLCDFNCIKHFKTFNCQLSFHFHVGLFFCVCLSCFVFYRDDKNILINGRNTHKLF